MAKPPLFHVKYFHLSHLEWLMAAQFGATLRKVNIRRKGAGYFMVIGVTKNGRALVAFFSGLTIDACYQQLFHGMYKSGIKWRPDKYP